MFIAHGMILHGRERISERKNNKDNRIFIHKIWKQRTEVGSKLILYLLAILAIISIFDLGTAIDLLKPITFIGMIGCWFIYIMHDEGRDDDEDLQPESPKIRGLLRLIDCRIHPFTLPLLLFIIVILTFLLSKQLGIELSLETGGNPRYVMSLPAGTSLTAGLAFACGFIYLIHHSDFLGIRQTRQRDEKVFVIHFTSIIVCGATFFIWVITLCMANFTNS